MTTDVNTQRPALFNYANMGKSRSAEQRRIGDGEPDYLDQLAELVEPEDWNGPDPQHAYKLGILRSYIIHTFARVQQQGHVAVSADERISAFNTGLATTHQESIYGVFRAAADGWRFGNWHSESHRAILDAFPTLPESASYAENPAELIYDWRRELKVNTRHVVEENIDRFPADLQNDLHRLRLVLDGAVAMAKKRVRFNYRAAVPFWYSKAQTVQLLLPLAMTESTRADLALVVSRHGEHYRGDTVLTMGMAYNNARLLARPDGDWLRPAAA